MLGCEVTQPLTALIVSSIKAKIRIVHPFVGFLIGNGIPLRLFRAFGLDAFPALQRAEGQHGQRAHDRRADPPGKPGLQKHGDQVVHPLRLAKA